MDKPAELFDRDFEWGDLTRFAVPDAPGPGIGVVYGRRRQGKSFLLRRLSEAGGGLYTMALEQEREPALRRFADAVAAHSGLGSGSLRFGDWEQAFDAVARLSPAGSRLPLPVVVDEFPYLLAHSPELPSVIQSRFDDWKDQGSATAPRLILCGSAVSVMSELLSGTKALRGRAVLDMCLRPFDFREAARFWRVDRPDVAFRVHAVLGGTPGYQDLAGPGTPGNPDELGEWLADHVLNPSHALFTEADYLLREDPRITDRAVYHSVLGALSAGASSPAQIASALGRPARSLAHPLDVLRTAGLVRRADDVLLQRRARLSIADPIVRFHMLITLPRLPEFEERRALDAWRASEATFSSKILGPHFEQLAREWTARYAGQEALAEPVGQVGPTVVNDAAGKAQHEVDVVALASGEMPRTANARILLLGEAKSSNRVRSVGDLRRLEHIRGLLSARGYRTDDARLALFARTGFDAELIREAAGRGDVLLIDLARMYGVE